ncbi:MAG: cobalamin biosynthesis protein [Candidatus Scalindua rubra]|uniref:Cobalamin biosynthesis protein CobD n=1 Tax=Candidatus Scalindua rubra TaxID=1872076 RepID=A0A1E3XGA9_9BACT|nr:MAG: cobalamin biosynthesis protein [Candidatus Scalindua rubra]
MYDYLPLQIAIAFILDFLIGDPRWIPHPVRIIGRCIEYLEKILLRIFISERVAGILLTGIVVFGTYLITYKIICIFSGIGKIWGIAISTIIIFYSLSIRDLLREAGNVLKALKSGNIRKARKNLSRIVGRDTHSLNEQQITRGCIETSAESSVDGIIAPLFYAFIGGPALAMAYKSINTLDSMVGYKNEKYCNFGWASAKLDDIVNYVPARIAAIILPISSYLCGADYSNSVKIVKRDSRKHPSPNSGIPEAAIAGALGIRLGGLSTYDGITSNKPFIGDPINNIVFDHINNTKRIVMVSAIFSVVFGIAFLLIGGYLSMNGNELMQIISELFSTKTFYKMTII